MSIFHLVTERTIVDRTMLMSTCVAKWKASNV